MSEVINNEREEPTFDMEAAVNEISASMFGEDSSTEATDEVVVDPVTPTPEALAAPEVGAVIDEKEVPKDSPASTKNAAPATWVPAAAALWDGINPLVQAEILRREQNIFDGLNQYREAANFGRQVNNAIAPYRGVLEQFKIDPLVQINSLMAAHHTLALGTKPQKMELFRRFAADYGVDIGELAGALGIGINPGQGPNNPSQLSQQNPEVQALSTRLDRVSSWVEEQSRTAEDNRRAAITTQVDAFAQNPANEFFPHVSQEMARLIAAGVTADLQEAYDRAVWAHPQIRTVLIQRQSQPPVVPPIVNKPNAVRRSAAAQAANVATRPVGVGGTTTPVGSLEDTLAATLADIKNRG